jgi:hypothetical protein
MYLLLVEETTHLALSLKQDDLTIELATFLNLTKAYNQLTDQDKQQLKAFATQYNQQDRLLIWLELMDNLKPKDLTNPSTWQKIANLLKQYDAFTNQALDEKQLKEYLDSYIHEKDMKSKKVTTRLAKKAKQKTFSRVMRRELTNLSKLAGFKIVETFDSITIRKERGSIRWGCGVETFISIELASSDDYWRILAGIFTESWGTQWDLEMDYFAEDYSLTLDRSESSAVSIKVSKEPLVKLSYDEKTGILTIVLSNEAVENLAKEGFKEWEGWTGGRPNDKFGWRIISESEFKRMKSSSPLKDKRENFGQQLINKIYSLKPVLELYLFEKLPEELGEEFPEYEKLLIYCQAVNYIGARIISEVLGLSFGGDSANRLELVTGAPVDRQTGRIAINELFQKRELHCWIAVYINNNKALLIDLAHGQFDKGFKGKIIIGYYAKTKEARHLVEFEDLPMQEISSKTSEYSQKKEQYKKIDKGLELSKIVQENRE